MTAFFSPPAVTNKWRTMVAVCLGLGMLMIDTFVVNVAFPTIGRDLGASLAKAEWTVSGYVLVLGVLPLAMGRLGDIFGRRRMYLWGLVAFIVSSALCGVATGINQLIAYRLLQGVGAAIMMPITLAILTHAFPPHQRGLAIGVWGGVSGLGLILGPVVGGLLVETGDWRPIFLVNVPLGVVALVMGLRWVGESRDEAAPRVIDWPGLVLLGGGLALIMFGFNRANDAGWTSLLILSCFGGGLAALVAFVGVERRVARPLIDLTLFRSRSFVMACVAAFLFSAAVFGTQPFTSLYMQNYLGFSPLEGGLAFLPATFLVATLMPFSGIIGQKLGPKLRLLVIAGLFAVAASFVLLTTIDVDSRYVDGMLPAFILRGIGIGLVMSALSLAVMSAIPTAKAGLASGTLTMARQTGTAFGVALFGAIYVNSVHGALEDRLPAELERRAEVVEAAEHFVPAGEGEVRDRTRAAVVDGFIAMSVVGLAVSAVATGSAFLIGNRRQRAGTATTSAAAVAVTQEVRS